MPSAPESTSITRARALGGRRRTSMAVLSLALVLAAGVVAAGWHRLGQAIVAVSRRRDRRHRVTPASGIRHVAPAAGRHTPDAVALARWDAAGRLIVRGLTMAWSVAQDALTSSSPDTRTATHAGRRSPSVPPVDVPGDVTVDVTVDVAPDITVTRQDRRQHLLRVRRHERTPRAGREPLARWSAEVSSGAADLGGRPGDGSGGLHAPEEMAGYARSVDQQADAPLAAGDSRNPASVAGSTGVAGAGGVAGSWVAGAHAVPAAVAHGDDVPSAEQPGEDAPADPAPVDMTVDMTADMTVDMTVDVAAEVVAEEPAVVLDLATVEAELADVEIALARLEAGTYWTCEVTGELLPDDLMAREPLRRRLPTA